MNEGVEERLGADVGGGDLGVAHSNREHIKVSDMLVAAEILVRYIQDWCA